VIRSTITKLSSILTELEAIGSNMKEAERQCNERNNQDYNNNNNV
jgi:hypothetical protein